MIKFQVTGSFAVWESGRRAAGKVGKKTMTVIGRRWNYIAEAFERRLATRSDQAFLYDEPTPKGVTCARGYEISGCVCGFGDIREAVLGRTAFLARLQGRDW